MSNQTGSTQPIEKNTERFGREVSWGDFLIYVKSQNQNWTYLKGLNITHHAMGIGKVVSVEIRSNGEPLIGVIFEPKTKPVFFNSHGFNVDMFFQVPPSLSQSIIEAVRAHQLALEEDNKKLVAFELRKLELEKLRLRQEAFDRKAEEERLANIEENLALQKARQQAEKNARITVTTSILRENGINYFWHFTSERNLPWISHARFLYGKSVNPYKDETTYLSNEISQSQDQYLGLDHFVRLSFIPNSWYFQRVRNAGTPGLVWLRFSLSLLETEEVFFMKGNGASSTGRMTPDLAELALDWEAMRKFQGPSNYDFGPRSYPSRYLVEGEDSVAFCQERDNWNSELLVKHSLPIMYCDQVYDARSGKVISVP